MRRQPQRQTQCLAHSGRRGRASRRHRHFVWFSRDSAGDELGQRKSPQNGEGTRARSACALMRSDPAIYFSWVWRLEVPVRASGSQTAIFPLLLVTGR